MSASNKLIQAASGVGVGEETDADFENTVLLLNADDASNGGQNNTFLDSSSNAHTITRNGNVTQGSFSPFSVDDGKWGNYFASSALIDSASTVPSHFGGWMNQDYTIEMWVNPSVFTTTTNGGSPCIGLCRQDTSAEFWSFGCIAGGIIRFYYYNGSPITFSTTDTIPLNEWTHIAFTHRDSDSSIRIYINGVLSVAGSTSGSPSNGTGNTVNKLTIGSGAAANRYTGYISNVRILAGTELTSFDITAPITSVTNTALLSCQSNRFVDNSTNNTSFTTSGTPKVVPFSPFPQTTVYDASTNGGSGLFATGDGTTDTLTATIGAIGTNDFTVEMWLYNTELNNQPIIDFGDYLDGITIRYNQVGTPPTISGYVDNSSMVYVSNPVSNEWAHFALTRSGSTLKAFYNGVQTLSTTSSTSLAQTNLKIGGINAGGVVANDSYTGYMSDVRIVIGTALYTSDFTVPTAPLTDVTNTEFLCNFTNASIVDATGRNVLETVGNAQVDTTTVKYGTGAMEFDGVSDYLKIKNSPAIEIGTGENFTIECWVYFNNFTQDTYFQRVWAYGTVPSSSFVLDVTTSGTLEFRVNDSILGSPSGNLSTGTWHHVALVRTGGNTVTIYIDGIGGTSGTTTAGATGYDFYVATQTDTNGNMNGYIDDLRITKGIARYTANFTPPTKALPVIGE